MKFFLLASWSQNSPALELWTPFLKEMAWKHGDVSHLSSPGCNHRYDALFTLLMVLPIKPKSFWHSRKRSWLFFLWGIQAHTLLAVKAVGILTHGGRDHAPSTSVAENWWLWGRPQISPLSYKNICQEAVVLVIPWSPAVNAPHDPA